VLGAVLMLGGIVLDLAARQATPVVTPAQLASHDGTGLSVQLVGRVVPGSVRQRRRAVDFSLGDASGAPPVRVSYAGALPDGFGSGALVTVFGIPTRGILVGRTDGLTVSCDAPSRGHC
jgi:cytochrome c-type biogenesis protein CcmE